MVFRPVINRTNHRATESQDKQRMKNVWDPLLTQRSVGNSVKLDVCLAFVLPSKDLNLIKGINSLRWMRLMSRTRRQDSGFLLSNPLNGPPLKWLNLPVMLQNDQHAASISRCTHLTAGTECLSWITISLGTVSRLPHSSAHRSKLASGRLANLQTCAVSSSQHPPDGWKECENPCLLMCPPSANET